MKMHAGYKFLLAFLFINILLFFPYFLMGEFYGMVHFYVTYPFSIFLEEQCNTFWIEAINANLLASVIPALILLLLWHFAELRFLKKGKSVIKMRGGYKFLLAFLFVNILLSFFSYLFLGGGSEVVHFYVTYPFSLFLDQCSSFWVTAINANLLASVIPALILLFLWCFLERLIRKKKERNET